MNNRFTEKRLAMATLSVAALFGVLGPAAAAAEDKVPTGYIMNFFEDSRHGTAVEDGAYDVVIEKLTKKDARGARRIADQVNLCVAYAKTKQVDKATESCDLALALAAQRATRPQLAGYFPVEKTRASEERAVALINRGVLYAVAGNETKAREMFEQADNVNAGNESAALNLLVLQREVAEKDT